MCHANNEKWQTTSYDGMELPNKDKIRTPGEKKTYKYLGILEADTIKHVGIKTLRNNISGELESNSRQNYQRNEYPGFTLVRYSGPFLKWTENNLSKWRKQQEK